MTALNLEQQRVAKLALLRRYFQHTIAAHFGVNQGRISEFRNSSCYERIEPASDLPAGFPRHS